MNCGQKRRAFIVLVLWLVVLFLPAGPAGAESGKTFLWQVGPDTGAVYLLGSLHMAKPDLYPLNPTINQAFALADVLVVEGNVNAMDQNEILSLATTFGMYPEGDSLEQHISEKTGAKAAEQGLSLILRTRLRPWLAAISLQITKAKSLGYDEKYGVDKHFLDRAGSEDKPIEELEGLEYQFKLLSSLSDEEQNLLLYSTLLEYEKMETVLEETIEAWTSGNAEKLEELFFKAYREHPEFAPLADKLVFQRNENMLAALEKYLKTDKTYFVVVGVGHMIGPKGLISRLKTKGYRVEQQAASSE